MREPVERERLTALHALKILDTPREDRFDRITRIAQRVFAVPMVAVTFIDRDRQWFTSSIDLDDLDDEHTDGVNTWRMTRGRH